MKNRIETLTFKLLIGTFLSGLTLSAHAEKWDLVSVIGESTYSQSSVWNGRPIGLNGKHYDFSSFYEATNIPFHLQGTLTYQVSNNALFTLPFKFDAGYESQLFTSTPQLNLGAGFIFGYDNFVVSFGLSNLFSFGGNVTERPCYDSFDRAFHCGTALPWSDVVAKLASSDPPVTASFRMKYRF